MKPQFEATRVLKARAKPAITRSDIGAVIAVVFLTAASIWLLVVDPKLPERVAAWAAILFFGGGGLLVVMSRLLPARPALRLDPHGITLLHQFPLITRLPLVGRFFGANLTLRWNEIAGFTILSVPQRVVGIIPRHFSAFSTPTALQRTMLAFVQRNLGALPTPAGLEMPADELLSLFQRYHGGAQG